MEKMICRRFRPAMITYMARTSPAGGLTVRKTEKEISKKKTPIERIFHDIFNREMTAKERRVLVGVSKNTRKTK
jgi:hypothetical protein